MMTNSIIKFQKTVPAPSAEEAEFLQRGEDL